MPNNKNLICALEKLVTLYKSHEKSEIAEPNKEAFSNAYNMSKEILASVKSENYGEAKYKWNLLQRFSTDSLPIIGKFSTEYRTLEQSIINFGLE